MAEIIRIPDGNAFLLRVTGQIRTGDYTEDVDFSVVTHMGVNFVRRGRIAQTFGLDSLGRIVIENSGNLAQGVYGVELYGYYHGEPWRNYQKNVFQIVNENANSDPGSDNENELTYDVTFDVTFGGDGISAAFVDATVATHNSNQESHPDLREALDGKVSDVKVGETSIVEEGVAVIDPDDFGKVDDVKVNGVSVVSQKEANVTVPTKVSDLQNDSDFASKSYVDAQVAMAGQVDDVKVNGVSVVSQKEANVTVPTKVSDLQNDEGYQTAEEVEQAIEENLVPNANVTVDNNTGTPSATVTKNGNSLDFAFHNMKGEKGDTGNDGEKGDTGATGAQGATGVYDATTQDFLVTLETTTGQSQTKTMTQKAITDELEATRVYQFEQIDAANYQVSNYYIRHDTGKWRSYSGTACVLVPVVPGDTYKIIGSGIYAAYLSDNTHVNGGTPTYSGGTTDEFTWPTGVAQIIPEGVNYLYVLTRMNNADITYELQRLMSIKEKIDNTVNDMVEGFSECLKSENNLHADLAIEDGNGHAVAVFKDGHIITKKFDSRIIGGKYEGKRISILGDSISTFGVPDQNNADGTWTWPGNRCRYPQSNLFSNVKYQYWYLLMERLGMKFGVNESWAGSRVSNTQETDDGDLGPNRCMSSLTRIGHLDANGTPDIILVYGGTNDANASGVTLGTFDTTNPAQYTEEQIAALPVATFADAYRAMLIRLQYYYPLARIVCLFPTYSPTWSSLANFNPEKLDRFEEVIREACDFFGVEYIDLRTAGITVFNWRTYLPDGIHPNALGMELIYDHLVRNIFN